MPATLQLDLLRGDVELSFAYLDRNADGRVVVGAGPWAETLLPDGMLATRRPAGSARSPRR
ncbi:hypothetical protein ACFFKH_03400 [Micromonospora marina]|uniref:Uncharacterized protein n=1 Tax=Micromonospora marina TaxID=307120 RepID=A0A1C4TYL0_9ACTN|nr:hypothetical protein [Micromonospora marina]SCE64545.1 hypothetical protein GA0070215_10188 [Micromonospora marina]